MIFAVPVNADLGGQVCPQAEAFAVTQRLRELRWLDFAPVDEGAVEAVFVPDPDSVLSIDANGRVHPGYISEGTQVRERQPAIAAELDLLPPGQGHYAIREGQHQPGRRQRLAAVQADQRRRAGRYWLAAVPAAGGSGRW